MGDGEVVHSIDLYGKYRLVHVYVCICIMFHIVVAKRDKKFIYPLFTVHSDMYKTIAVSSGVE